MEVLRAAGVGGCTEPAAALRPHLGGARLQRHDAPPRGRADGGAGVSEPHARQVSQADWKGVCAGGTGFGSGSGFGRGWVEGGRVRGGGF